LRHLEPQDPIWVPKHVLNYDESPVLPIVSFSTGLNADAEVFTPLGIDRQLQYFTTPQLEVPQGEVVLDYLLAGTSATPSVPTLEALPMAMTSTLSLDDPEGWSNLAKDMMWQIANLYNKIDELKAKYDPLDVLESMATLETRLKLLENDERTHHMKLTAHVANLASDIEIMDGLFLAHGLSGTTQACPAPAYLDDATVAGLRDRLDAVEIVASETKAVDQRLVLLSREIGAIRDDLDEHIITTDVSFRTCGEQWRESAKRTEIKERNIRTAIDELATRVSAFDMIDYAHMVEVVAPFLNQLPKRPVPDLLSSIDAISLMKADISQLNSNILNIRASVNAITEESDERFSRCADGTVVDEKFVILRNDISSTISDLSEQCITYHKEAVKISRLFEDTRKLILSRMASLDLRTEVFPRLAQSVDALDERVLLLKDAYDELSAGGGRPTVEKPLGPEPGTIDQVLDVVNNKLSMVMEERDRLMVEQVQTMIDKSGRDILDTTSGQYCTKEDVQDKIDKAGRLVLELSGQTSKEMVDQTREKIFAVLTKLMNQDQ